MEICDWKRTPLSLENVLQLNVRKMLCIYILCGEAWEYGIEEENSCTMFFVVWDNLSKTHLVFTPDLCDDSLVKYECSCNWLGGNYDVQQFNKNSNMVMHVLDNAKQLHALICTFSVAYHCGCEVTMLVNQNQDETQEETKPNQKPSMFAFENNDNDNDNNNDNENNNDNDNDYEFLPDVGDNFLPVSGMPKFRIDCIQCDFKGTAQMYAHHHFCRFSHERIAEWLCELER